MALRSFYYLYFPAKINGFYSTSTYSMYKIAFYPNIHLSDRNLKTSNKKKKKHFK